MNTRSRSLDELIETALCIRNDKGTGPYATQEHPTINATLLKPKELKILQDHYLAEGWEETKVITDDKDLATITMDLANALPEGSTLLLFHTLVGESIHINAFEKSEQPAK